MRLLRCTPQEPNDDDVSFPLFLEENQANIPPYAILSHRWSSKPDEEVSFVDLENGTARQKGKGYRKLIRCCEQAVKDGYEYVWVDTCCIDKRSSAELSEAINSMYMWYKRSSICYAYLEDVSKEESMEKHANKGSSFRGSEWFKRGWTLQELIAPASVRFYAGDWSFIATRSDMADLVKDITKIDVGVLKSQLDQPMSVAKRMSWATGRQTSREEDKAYSLMGLFGVNMPTLYGEGPRAFIRLQEEILRSTYDHSLFAWKMSSPSSGLLAASPDQFSGSADIVSMDYNTYAVQFGNSNPKPEYASTNFGIRIQLPLQKIGDKNVYRAYLACTTPSLRSSTSSKSVYVTLKMVPGAGVDTYERIDFPDSTIEYIENLRPNTLIKDVYISNPTLSSLQTKPSAGVLLEVQFLIKCYITNPESDAVFSPYNISYYSGLSVKRSLEPSFTVQFRKDEENQFVVIFTGFVVTYGSIQIQVKMVFVVLGFYKGRPWTDVCIHVVGYILAIQDS